jgi:hypothetical protein
MAFSETAIFSVMDVIGIFLMLVAFAYVTTIGRRTGWFAAWGIIAAALALIVAQRAFEAYITFIGFPPPLVRLNSGIQLILSVVLVVGFGMLYRQLSMRRRK